MNNIILTSEPITPEIVDDSPRAAIRVSCVARRETLGAITVQIVRGEVEVKTRAFAAEAGVPIALELEAFDMRPGDDPQAYSLRVVGDCSSVDVTDPAVEQIECAELQARLDARRAKRIQMASEAKSRLLSTLADAKVSST